MIRYMKTARKQSGKAGTKRPRFIPGLLVVKIKEDVVANVPEVRRITATTARALHLPEAIEKRLQLLQSRNVIREVIPIFAKTLSRRTSGAHLSAMILYPQCAGVRE